MATSTVTIAEFASTPGAALHRWTRAADVVLALFGITFFAPLLVLVSILILLDDGGPVSFAHRRIGRGGRHFRCLKFRSMVRDADVRLQHLLETCPESRAAWQRDQKLRNDPRITTVGRFLRVSSLDELPQLWNVLVGDMSLVGPRPITDEEITRYGRYFADYVRVRPGITGLWQISGRSNVSYRRRVALDVAYARSQSLGLFFKILVLTIPSVLFARGSG